MNPRAVVISDGSDAAVACISNNILLNSSNTPQSVKVSACVYQWGQHSARVLGTDEEFADFDVILGAEVAYSKNAINPLLSSVERLLSRARPSRFIFTHTARFSDVDNAMVE